VASTARTRNRSGSDGAGKETAAAAAMAAEAAIAPATFPIGDCGARLIESDVVHEYVFAEFKEANRTIDELPIPLVLLPVTFLLPLTTLAQPQAMTLDAGSFGALASSSALEAFGGVPVNRAFEKDLSDLQEPVVPEVKFDNVTQLLNARGGTVRLPTGQAQVQLDDDAVADLTAGRPTMVLGKSKKKGKGSVPLTLIPPPPAAASEPLQTVYRVGPAEGFIRNPFVKAVDGSSIRLDLTAHQLQALHEKGETKLHVNGQSVTLEAGDEVPVASSFALEAASDFEAGGTGTVVVADVAPVRVETTEVKPVEPEKPKSKPVGQLKLALYMPWRHTWKLKGYTRGELLHALALAPQEEVNLEVSTWDRRKRAYEDTAESEFEQTKEFTETQKDSQAVVKEMANQNTFGINIGGTVGFTQAGFNVTGTQGADARTSLNNSSKVSVESMAESVRRSTMKLRLQRQTKIAETTELGTEDKVSRRIRNPNLCHTLQLNYYEVLANYEIEITFDRAEARLCVLIDNEELGLQEFDYTNIRYFESVLKRVLLVPSLESGFEAAHRLYAQDQLCEARRRNDMCSGVEKLAKKPTEDEEALTAQVGRIVKSYSEMHTAGPAGRKKLSAWSILSGAFGLPGLVWTMELIDTQQFQRWLYRARARQLEPHLFDLLAELNTELAKPNAKATLEQVHDVIDALAAIPDLSKLKGSSFVADGDALYQILRETFGIKSFEIFNDIPPDAYAVNDCGVVAGLSTLREMVADLAEKKAKEEAVDAMAENQAAALATVAARDTAADLEAVEALRTHLNSYRNYYRAAIFQLMPWSDAFQQAIAPYYPLVGRDVLGFSGNSLALPVTVDLDPRLQAFYDELVTKNDDLISMKSTLPVTLPTSGVHLENRLGKCSGCEEYVERIRELDLKSKRQSLRQQRLENERYQARLDAKDYRDPIRRPPLVRIEEDGQPDGAPPAGPVPPAGPAQPPGN
jgi:hypothetical protein